MRSGGGTKVIEGFKLSKELLAVWLSKNGEQKCENRIIMLTDVCDNSISHERGFIEATASEGINTSIIGISTEFKSEVCESFKEIKGFNYFCAVSQEDIKKYVFETFDFGFFPSANNIEITLLSDNVTDIEVYGTPDSDKKYEKECAGNI